MKILYIDIDSLRADHLGCYGYHRNTSPNIDAVAKRGTRFENYYVSDAPCLPSRTALFTGRLGIHTGVINHGGLNADLRPQGPERLFANRGEFMSWMTALRSAGLYTASISPFAERHAAWHVLDGFQEVHNTGKRGQERADEVTSVALKWIEGNAEQEKWFLHVNMWDPHTPYRTPLEYGNPFAEDPAPEWLTEERIRSHFESYGPHSAQELHGWGAGDGTWPRTPDTIASQADFKKWIDGYDVGIHYADRHVGEILDALSDQGILDNVLVIISADHGENQGELNVYGDHHTADQPTCRVPLIVAGPGIRRGVDRGLHYQVDLPPTVTELVGGEAGASWDGQSFAKALTEGDDQGREYLVISQGAWSCQRSVRFGPWLFVRTYHDGFKDFPDYMLFALEQDPHETNNLVDTRPDVVGEAMRLLDAWWAQMMRMSPSDVDPMWTVIQEGGPFHVRGSLHSYAARLRETGRARHAERLGAKPGG